MKLSRPTLLLLTLSLNLSAQSTLVQTEAGKVEGVQEDGSVISFKGIPFAAPPVGILRWQPPQPPASWKGIKKADTFGPSPMQAVPRPFAFWSSEFLIPESPISEDCLYLNVWTPDTEPEQKKPVLVYIYGGGFRSGGAGCPIYDGNAMARKDLVFVSINYRVGLFGFLAHPELSQESAKGVSGNYGLLDMVTALHWVKNNIAAFGGDPDNVTIAGQSAGAFAVNYLTAMPSARGLFHKAIAQSGGSFYASPLRRPQNLEAAEKQGLALAESLGVSSLADLRNLAADSILKANAGTQWPIVDGNYIPLSIDETYRQGKQASVPLLAGWNKDDLVFVREEAAAHYKAGIDARFGKHAPAFLKAYPASTQAEANSSQRRMSRDEGFGLQVFTWGRMQQQAGQPVYLYNFNRELPAYSPETAFGAFHSGEIVYAYDNLHTLDRPWEAADKELANVMSAYWANFCATGDPNRPNVPRWPKFEADQQHIMALDTQPKAVAFPDREVYGLWTEYHETHLKN